MSEFWDVFPVLVIFPTFGLMLKWYLDYRIRKQLIDKGAVDEKVKFLNFHSSNYLAPSSLKWGLVLFLVGLSLLILMARDLAKQFMSGHRLHLVSTGSMSGL